LGAQTIVATLVLRRRNEIPQAALGAPVPRDVFAANYGADPDDIDLVTSTLTALGADVIEVDPPSRRVRVSGAAAVLSRIFGTTLDLVSGNGPEGAVITFRQRVGELSVPAPLAGVVTAVLGLDNRPQCDIRSRIATPAAVVSSYTPPQVANAYRFPAGTDGSGQTVAVLELGGGYSQADLDAYFGGLGIPSPKVTAVGVDGAANTPGLDPNGADGEVMLDIEVIGAIAPGAAIVVYFAPNTDSGFLDALSQAAHAAVTPVAISISWGQREDGWTAQARTAFDQALLDASVLGVTVTAAAGDNGSSDGAVDGAVHVDFPASSPHALACGGTRLDANPTTGAVTSEVVWNNSATTSATGGGISTDFALPSWQGAVGVPLLSGRTGRGVPDVAGNADPQTGYQIRVAGKPIVIGGTSAVSPLWAALIARLAQVTAHPFGLIAPQLYGHSVRGAVPPGFRDITSGNNGAYSAGPGWDACTGLGVPVGEDLVVVLGGGSSPPNRRG
jgi:kumamolisin